MSCLNVATVSQLSEVRSLVNKALTEVQPISRGGTGETTVSGAQTALQIAGHAGQTWKFVSRQNGVTYTNTTGAPIVVQATAFLPQHGQLAITVGAVDGTSYVSNTNVQIVGFGICALVPVGETYSFHSNVAVHSFRELS